VGEGVRIVLGATLVADNLRVIGRRLGGRDSARRLSCGEIEKVSVCAKCNGQRPFSLCY
jgi:hypothetical protein